MLNKFLEKNPDSATFLGLHEPYDYLLPNGSSELLVENLRLLENWVKKLKETIKYENLSYDHKIDLEVIEKTYQRWKFNFYEVKMHELDPDAFEGFGGLIFIMFTRNYAPLEKRTDAIAARIEKVPKFLEEFRSRFTKAKPVKLWTEVALEKIQNMSGLFQFVLYATKGKVSEKVYEKLRKAIESLQPVLKTHTEWLRDLLPKSKEDHALGREKFEKLLQLRELGMNSEEIYQLGLKYLDELKTEREQLAHRIAPGKSGRSTQHYREQVT